MEKRETKQPFFKTTWFWIVSNVILAVAAILVIMLLFQGVLSLVTRQNNEIYVPDFTGMTEGDAVASAGQADVSVLVVDTVYFKHLPKGSVVSQNPLPGAKVKKGRNVRLTINATETPLVTVPDLTDMSLRIALDELAYRGLYAGKLSYVSDKDQATDLVRQALYKGVPIVAGKKIPKGSRIDLVLGMSYQDYMTVVPKVQGMNCSKALRMIHNNSLNVGRICYDRNIRSFADSSKATVYKQTPAPGQSIMKGSRVTVYLSLE